MRGSKGAEEFTGFLEGLLGGESARMSLCIPLTHVCLTRPVGPHQWQDLPVHSQILQNSGVSFSTHSPPSGCDEWSEFNAYPNSPTSLSSCPVRISRTFLRGIKFCVILLERANIDKTLPGPCRERQQNSKERLMLAGTLVSLLSVSVTASRWCEN